MDTDPCLVASRTEIFEEKIDLTPSEHAGVALTEDTTLVSERDYSKAPATLKPSNYGTLNIKTIEELKPVDGNVNAITWCEICNISCATNIYAKHASGKKHKKNLDKIPKLLSTGIDSATQLEGKNVNLIKGGSVSCELCGIYCNSLELLKSHIAGKKHQKKMLNSEKQTESNEEGKIVILEGGKRKGDGSLSSDEDADTKKQKVDEEEEAGGVSVSCKVCNVSFNGFPAFQTHLASVEHTEMERKQAERGSDGLQV